MNRDQTPRGLRWFQAGLRDVLWFIVACCLLFGWWHDSRQESDGAARARVENERLRSELTDAYGLLNRAHGRIVAVRPEEGFVQINVGADAGLTKGDVLEVFRVVNGTPALEPVGEIRLIVLDKNASVGRITSEHRAPIEKGSLVATRSK